MWPNSLHPFLSLLKGFPDTLGHFICGLLSNLPKRSSGSEVSSTCLELPMMICWEGSAIRLVEMSAMCKISPVIASLEPFSRLGYEGLKRLSDRFTIQVQVIQSLCKVRQLFLQSPFRRSFGLSLVGEQMRVKGAVAPWATLAAVATTF